MTGTTALHPGGRFPALAVALPGGDTVHLPDDLAGHFSVMLFYRGAWYPHCNALLRAFQRALHRLTRVGHASRARCVRPAPAAHPVFISHAGKDTAMSLTLTKSAAGVALLAGLAAGYTAATLGALLISLSVGLFGFHESIKASFVTLSLVIETITLLALPSWTALVASGTRPAPSRPDPQPCPPGAPRS